MDGTVREPGVRPAGPRAAVTDRARTPPPSSQTRTPIYPPGWAVGGASTVQFLQSAAGNAAVARMLARPASPASRQAPTENRPLAPARSAPGSGGHGPSVARAADATVAEAPSGPETKAAEDTDILDGRRATAGLLGSPADLPPDDPRKGGDGPGGTVTPDGPTVQRKVAGADFPGAGLILDAVRAIPGYHLMAQITGEDPITGDRVTTGRAEFVQTLLSYGPFGPAVGPVLQAMDALDQIFTLVRDRLGQHNLTMSRIEHDVAAAWDEIHVADGIDANVAVVRRYVAAFLNDVRAFAAAVAADVIAAVRAAAVSFATPLVQTPAIKPVWDLGTKVFHYDPLKGEVVNAPTAEILADFLHLIGKDEALARMRERGTLERTAEWLDAQFATFVGLKSQATALFADAWAAISPENLPHLVDNIHSLAQRAFSLLQQVGSFAGTVLARVVSLIKDALLGMLSERAHQTRGFTALTVMLGKDPFTEQPVPRSPQNLIRAFITLLPNGDQVFEQLSQSGVIDNAAGRIESEMTRLGISWEMITGTFRAIWNQLSLEDLANPIGAFLRIINQFEEPLGRIVSFAATVLQVVIELVLRLMNFPSELLGNIIANAMAAIEDIKRDPIQFLKNIVEAMKRGVMAFLDNIGTHLLHGLTDWLFRGLRGMGIEPPKDLSLQSIITFVLQVLGISERTLWDKLGRKIGPERVARLRAAIDRAGQAWQFVKDVQERGIAAVWEFISGQLSNLWDMILQKAEDWIMSEIINKVTAKLLSMLDPTGIMAVVNSCIAFFNAVQSAIEYLREILQIVDRYVSTIASIARGEVEPGAKMLEGGLAQAVPVAIGFLANQVGLGNVPEKVAEILHGFQAVVDEALDWLVDQAWSMGQAALNALAGGGGGERDPAAPTSNRPGFDQPWPQARTSLDMDGVGHSLWMEQSGSRHLIYIASSPGHLLSRAQAAHSDPNCPSGAKGPLGEIVTDLDRLEREVAENERLYVGRGTETGPMGPNELRSEAMGGSMVTRNQYRQGVTNLVVLFRARLEALGHQFHIKDLQSLGHRSRFVEGDSIKSEYRGEGVWRPEFYGGWNTAVYADKRRASMIEGREFWLARNPGARIPDRFDLYLCSHCHEYFSDAGYVVGYPIQPWTLDHTESVVRHWNKNGGGRFMVQSAREAWYNLPSNLAPMCRRCNQEDERVEDWRVHPRFRGRSDAPADPSDEA